MVSDGKESTESQPSRLLSLANVCQYMDLKGIKLEESPGKYSKSYSSYIKVI